MAVQDILTDTNFLALACKKMEAAEFAKAVEEHCGGWREKRRLADGMKVLQEKVQAMEQKLQVAKAVGKAKGKLDYDEQKLADTYDQYNLRDKVTGLNASIQSMIDEGRLSASEIPVCVAHLQGRIDKAKAGGKTTIQEKLEKMIKQVMKVQPVEVPVTHLPELFNHHNNYEGITKLQGKKAASQTDADRKRLATKDTVWGQMKALEARSRMWFETENEYDYRLDCAMKERAKNLAEELKREAEEEAERERLAYEEHLRQKKVEQEKKEEIAAKALADKIAAKRAEAALKPVKAIPKKKVVEKVVKQMNPFELFLDPKAEQDKLRAQEAEAQEGEWEDTTQASPEPAKPEAAAPKAAAPTAAAPKVEPKVEPKAEAKPKAVPKKNVAKMERLVIENKWGSAPAPEQLEGEDVELTMEEAAKVAEILDGPSLSDAIKAEPKKKDQKDKIAPPQPKKKEKKKAMKVSAADLGFEC